MKYFMGALVGVAIATLVLFFVLSQKGNADKLLGGQPAPTATITSTSSPYVSPVQTEMPMGSGASTGEISGKLCYPSEFLPAGTIEAKSTISNTVVSMAYEGSEAGAGNTYTLAVPAGSYILRYYVGENTIGYHTDICPTGAETSCAADNPRNHISVVVTSGKTVSGIDLCDFYYSEATEPTF